MLLPPSEWYPYNISSGLEFQEGIPFSSNPKDILCLMCHRIVNSEGRAFKHKFCGCNSLDHKHNAVESKVLLFDLFNELSIYPKNAFESKSTIKCGNNNKL